jgi:hypothetical protein
VHTESVRHSPNPKTKWRFDVEAGQETIPLPEGISADRIARVYLLGQRNRPISVQIIKLGELMEMGRKFVFSTLTGTEEFPIKGFPLYCTVGRDRIMFWPVPAHNWSGFIEGEESDSAQDC